METIRNYLENMFASLPRTPDVYRLKEELASNMEDKYSELKAAGKSENEAVGTVIAEFGNIEELAAAMGISLYQSAQTQAPPAKPVLPLVGMQEAEDFLENEKRASVFIAAGVALCILGPAVLITTLVQTGYSNVGIGAGILAMFLMIAVAVGLFIYSGAQSQRFKYMESPFELTADTAAEMQARYRFLGQRGAIFMILGIGMILLGVALMIAMALIFDIGELSAATLLVFVAVGTATLILGGSESESYKKLLQVEEYSKKSKEGNKVVGAIAAFWWPLATCVFLIWGFFGPGGFGSSWIVWPVAGILFGAVSAMINAIKGNNNE